MLESMGFKTNIINATSLVELLVQKISRKQVGDAESYVRESYSEKDPTDFS